ncbi:hypothetical protein NDU88_000032 [Pleurodeles waltl]|uniref:Uncharacterized protein n=1 Tax=Pleurodeles waltl TaxID=8319 RepID=A0AAV7KM12_PLEWA|nr:hypothetical protein NDU88_000032 [Pleurodeles waltl]
MLVPSSGASAPFAQWPPRARPSNRGPLYPPIVSLGRGSGTFLPQGGPPGARPVLQVCAGVQSGCPLHQRPLPPDTPCRMQGRRHSKAPGSRAPARPMGSGRFSLLARVGTEGPHAPPVAVTPSSAVSGTQGFPRSALQQPPGRRGAAPSPQPRSAGSPSNGARSHAQPRIRSLAQSGSRH